MTAAATQRVSGARDRTTAPADNLLAWRLVRPAYGEREVAFSGEGARRYGGRWNTPGRPMVYTSLHLSLAALETLAHADRRRFERDYLAYEVRVPSVLVPQERNLLLDPTHPDFAEVAIAAPQRFRFDDRVA